MMVLAIAAQAQKVDTIRVGHRFKQFKNLELGTVTDVVYNEANGRLNGAIKKRTTELVQINGQELVKIVHEWNSPNEQWSGRFEYYCEPYTMKPVQHIRETKMQGKEAFKFNSNTIEGLDSAVNNKQKDFALSLSEQTYNWEVDLETYSLIPMKEGNKVVMNFYHPGGQTPPKYYTLAVEGSEKLKLANGQELDCWIIFTDYGGTQPTRFWYTKRGQNFVKMEGQYGPMKIYKTRLY
ncbi:MAG: hypothetical protein HWE21_14385 [Cytophagia bacterium]|nr:hypothetical protein [Cytophagia bacterium]